MNINGNGMGHMSTCLAYANRLRGRARPVFFSLASAIEIINDMGYEADYLVSRFWSRASAWDWDQELSQRLGMMFERVRPQVVVFDGTWPIHQAGFVLQVDCPDLAGARHTDYQAMDDKGFLADAEKSIEALNAATSDIPPEAMRMHICWLNYAGPHTHDIPIKKLFGLLAKARPQGLLFEAPIRVTNMSGRISRAPGFSTTRY